LPVLNLVGVLADNFIGGQLIVINLFFALTFASLLGLLVRLGDRLGEEGPLRLMPLRLLLTGLAIHLFVLMIESQTLLIGAQWPMDLFILLDICSSVASAMLVIAVVLLVPVLKHKAPPGTKWMEAITLAIAIFLMRFVLPFFPTLPAEVYYLPLTIICLVYTTISLFQLRSLEQTPLLLMISWSCKIGLVYLSLKLLGPLVLKRIENETAAYILNHGLFAVYCLALSIAGFITAKPIAKAAVADTGLPEGWIINFIISDREADVLKLLLQGLANKEIANLLFVSNKTVEKHLSNIYKKVGVQSRNELMAKAASNHKSG
jgi:DNA-binding CsgD family transcriptional regulator